MTDERLSIRPSPEVPAVRPGRGDACQRRRDDPLELADARRVRTANDYVLAGRGPVGVQPHPVRPFRPPWRGHALAPADRRALEPDDAGRTGKIRGRDAGTLRAIRRRNARSG